MASMIDQENHAAAAIFEGGVGACTVVYPVMHIPAGGGGGGGGVVIDHGSLRQSVDPSAGEIVVITTQHGQPITVSRHTPKKA